MKLGDLGGIDVIATGKAAVKDFIDADLQGMAAEIAYHLLFSLVPLLIFFTALSGEIGRRIGTGDVVEQLTNWLRTDANLPQSTVDVVLVPIEQILDSQTGGLLSVGAVIALWSGKNAIAALMKGLNVSYNVKETRPWFITWPIAIGLTIVLALAAVLASALTVISSDFGSRIASALNLSSQYATVWSWLRLPLTALILVLMVSFFYWAAPNRRVAYHPITVGAVVTVVLWGVATLALGFYFDRLAGWVLAYGLLGGLLGFLFWLWVMSLILLLGGMINAILRTQRHPVSDQTATAAGRVAERATPGLVAGGAPAGAAAATRVDRLGVRTPEPTAAPVPTPLPARTISDEVRLRPADLPSAAAAVRRDEMGSEHLASQRGSTIKLLAGSAVAAISGLLIGWRSRA